MYILFDIGGTNMRIAATQDGESFGDPVILPTPKTFEEGIALFAQHAHILANGEKIEGIVGGIAGTLTQDKGTLIASPNLSGWIGNPLRGKLLDLFKVPIYIENDSAMVGLGEATYGAGQGFDIVAYITISTGVGGARIVNGVIDESSNGFEPGHQIIDPDNSMCPECDGNDLESYISGTSITKRYGVKP
ncbi:MAG: ROK family protein, partial [Candidatus Yonathbacteria bacterium]|nr:ROK family protein [Candidatus Yonathbacteria bacterium]